MLKVLVMGAGAVGLGLTSFLLQSGCRVSLITRDDTELVKNGLYRVTYGGYASQSEARFALKKVKANTNVSAWLLKIN